MSFKYITSLLFLVLFFGCKGESKKERPAPQEKAIVNETIVIDSIVKEPETPKSTYEDLDGNPIELVAYKGKKIFLNYWATWCRPCIEEMPAIERLQTVLEKENYIFILASDQAVSKITKFKEAHSFDFNYIKFNGSLAEEKITALPVTIIYNEAGEQIARFDGGEIWDAPEMIQKLKQL